MNDVAQDSATIRGPIACSSITLTPVDAYSIGGFTGTMVGRIGIELWNDSPGQDICISFKDRSTDPGDGDIFIGASTITNCRRLPPRTSWNVSLGSRVPIFCLSSASADASFPTLIRTQIK